MCSAVYILSDRPLPAVPRVEERQVFSVEDITNGHFYPHNHLVKHFGRKWSYLAGCHIGCGCGFAPGSWTWEEATQTELVDLLPSKNPESRRGLADYLSVTLRDQPMIEVYICVSGEESNSPQNRRQARPADFLQDFSIYESMGQLVVVSENESESSAAADSGFSSLVPGRRSS